MLEHGGEQLALGILQIAMDVLIDRHRHDARREQLDDLGILKGRRTVGDAVVSDATERMPGPAEHVDWLVLLRGEGPRLDQG